MSTSNPITSFGIYQAVIKDLVTFEMFQMLILDSVEPDFTQDLVDLRGGGAAFPWASAPGEAAGEIAMTIKQYDAGVLKYFSPFVAGAITEALSGEIAGNVGAISNVIGTTVSSGVTGIASIAVDPAGALKFGDYIAARGTGATKLDLFVNTDIDGLTFTDDSLRIATDIVIPNGTTVTSNGLQFTGGSAVAMVAGDKAHFSIRPISSYLMQHKIGATGSSPKEFELTVVAEKIGNKIRVVRYPKVISSGGAGLKFMYKDWATFSTTVKILQDPIVGYAGLETILNR